MPAIGRVRRFLARRRGRWTLGIIAALALGYLLFWLLLLRGLPSTDTLLTYEPPLPTNVRAYDGMPVYSFARERRVELAYEELPPVLVQAFLSAEDKDFFRHHGIDPMAFGAAVFDYARKYGSDERARGGSTITQQVAKNLLIGNEYSPTRKIREAVLALRIEGALSKPQILELYLNQIFLGRNAYGVESAARAYFAKSVGALTLSEAAYLAVLPKAPSNYDPEHHTERALTRRRYVLEEMRANGFITSMQEASANAAPLGTVERSDARREAERRFDGHFMEEVRRQLVAKYGTTDADGANSVYAGGLWVRTSLDPKVQTAMEGALRDGLIRYDAAGGWRGRSGHIDDISGDWHAKLAATRIGAGYGNWRTGLVLERDTGKAELGFLDGTTGDLFPWGAAAPKRGIGGRAFDFLKQGDVVIVARAGTGWALRSIPQISGGMVAENPHTGQVVAMQGGFDGKEAFNRATQAMRQPGSSFKPFVYMAALDSGMTPASILVDGPFCVFQTVSLGTKCFRNFTGGYAGSQTMRWGVEQSRNLMTVRAASAAGMGKVVATAKAMGVGSYPPYIAYSLGAGDTTVLKMVNAYSMIANQGRKMTPTLIDYVQDRRGKLIWRADKRECPGCNAKDWNGSAMPRPRARYAQAIDAMTAYQMLHIMEGVVLRGTATVLRDLGRPLFGKTGTNTGPTSVWFVGGSADLVAGVYLGYDRPRPLGGYAQGGTVAAPVFRQFAQVAMKDMPVVPFRAPAGVRMVRIDRRSGRKVFAGWPVEGEYKPAIIWEAFKPESEPRRAVGRQELAAARVSAKPATIRNDSDFLRATGGIY